MALLSELLDDLSNTQRIHTCASCGQRFHGSEAHCEDWRDPARSLGCPHCGTYLMPIPDRWRLGRLLAVFVAVLAIELLLAILLEPDIWLALLMNGIGIAVGVVLAMAWCVQQAQPNTRIVNRLQAGPR